MQDFYFICALYAFEAIMMLARTDIYFYNTINSDMISLPETLSINGLKLRFQAAFFNPKFG